MINNATDDSRDVVRGLIVDTIKQYVVNSKGKHVADYRIIKDATVAHDVLNALNNI